MNKLVNRIRFALRDPRAMYYYAQKGIRHLGLRRLLASTIARFRRRPSGNLREGRSSGWLEELRHEGYLLIPEMLSTAQLADIHRHLAKLPCVDLFNPDLGEFDMRSELSSTTRVARYKPEDLLSVPHLMSAANSPELLATIGHYIGCEPTVTLFEAWWSIPTVDTQSGITSSYRDYQFHRDVEDFKFVKLFIYLSEVGETSGPHVFVAGSHEDRRLTQRSSLDARAVTESFGATAQLQITGPAGLGMLEDTFGIHRATPPVGERRLICSITYCLTGLSPFSPTHPPGVLPAGTNPFVYRLFCQ